MYLYSTTVELYLKNGHSKQQLGDMFNIKSRTMKTYTGRIEKLLPNQIFVFGSNTEGRHGKGSALIARKLFGAVYGKAVGLQGNSYAIVTKDLTKDKHPSISAYLISDQILELYEYARNHKDKEFLVAYNGLDTNLNGYTNQQLANMFSSPPIPENVIFEENFAKLL